MRTLAAVLCVVVVLLSAATSPRSTDPVRLDAARPDKAATTLSPEDQKRMRSNGVIVAFKQGDEIKLVFDLVESDLIEQLDNGTFRVKRSFYLYTSPHGVRTSLDGERFDPSASTGSISLDFATTEESNTFTIQLGQKLLD